MHSVIVVCAIMTECMTGDLMYRGKWWIGLMLIRAVLVPIVICAVGFTIGYTWSRVL